MSLHVHPYHLPGVMGKVPVCHRMPFLPATCPVYPCLGSLLEVFSFASQGVVSSTAFMSNIDSFESYFTE